MAEKMYTWTIDTELNFGGRTEGTSGIDFGLPIIFKLFKERNIKGLFFVSTEVMEKRLSVTQDILNEGHEVGNHGHFHIPFKEPWRQIQSKEIADNILREYTGKDFHEFRAPKFSYQIHGHRYSDPKGHVGLLKHTWFGGKINEDSIFYLHPFDIVRGDKAPNLFCKIWYSKPEMALNVLRNLTRLYPGNNRLEPVTN